MVYDKPLFADWTAVNIYNAPKEVASDDEEQNKKNEKRGWDKPVEFEMHSSNIISTSAGLHH